MNASAFALALISVLACNNSKQTSGPAGPTTAASASSPLMTLDAKGAPETLYKLESGTTERFMSFPAQRLVLSVNRCRQADLSLDCDAVKFLRNGPDVAIPKAKMTGAVSAGALVCAKLGYAMLTARAPNGDEDGVCKFPDGSMASLGALEQYRLKAE